MSAPCYILTWEDDWLVCRVGPWAFRVAFVEKYSDGKVAAFLYGWSLDVDDATLAPVKPTKDETFGVVEVMCRDAAEAQAVVCALSPAPTQPTEDSNG